MPVMGNMEPLIILNSDFLIMRYRRFLIVPPDIDRKTGIRRSEPVTAQSGYATAYVSFRRIASQAMYDKYPDRSLNVFTTKRQPHRH